MKEHKQEQAESRGESRPTTSSIRKPFQPPRLEHKGRLVIQAGSINLWQKGP